MSALTEIAEALIGGRYELLDLVGSGALGEVHVARDRLTERRVALKRVHPHHWRDAFDAKVALAHEFSVLSALRHPHVISVLDYGFELSGQPFYTMNYIEDALTIRDAAVGQRPERAVELIFQVLQALAYMHRQGVLHRDLKPSNVLVREEHVTVLDFNLASTTDEAREGGTPQYMAPEVLDGEPSSTASDLYAVGVLAYEMLTGALPFDGNTPASVLAATLLHEPDLDRLPVGEAVRAIIRQLLSKSPSDRYEDANRVMEAFASAAGLDVPLETAALRDSYVRAAAFVGRDRELEMLTGAVERAQDGRGSSWLLGGESGVGKSRIVAELRSWALIRGVRVLRGQAVTEAGKPHELFRAPVLRLLLDVPVSDLEAGVLLAVFPGVDRILEREVEDPPPLDPQGAAERLADVIERVFSRIERPTLLELEDCHWAHEGLLLLDRINRIVTDVPLIIVGTYRDDERPEIATDHPSMTSIKVERFRTDEIATLGASMLGDSLGRDQRIVAFLSRETEGNAFFLTEAVRAVAEEVGRLDRVRSATLPEHVFSAGMRSLMLRRLERLPATALPGLRAAALIGRRIDAELLAQVDPDLDIDTWLALCGASAVLAPRGYGWEFAHDKLRETVLEELDPTMAQHLHRRIAEAIESLHGAESAEWIPSLATHWEGAGVAEKAIPYLMQAALQVFNEGAASETVRLTNKAVRLLGFELPTRETLGEAIQAEMAKIERLMAGRDPSELVDLPALENEAVETAIQALGLSIPGAHQSNQYDVFAMVVLRSVALTLEYGVGPNAPFIFSCYAFLLRAMTGDTALALALVELAGAWDARRDGRVSAAVRFVDAWFVHHWRYHQRETLPLYEEAEVCGFETGDVQFGCFGAAGAVVACRTMGMALPELIERARSVIAKIESRVLVSEFHAVLELQVAKALAGRTASLLSLTDEEFDEAEDVASICHTTNLSSVAYYYGAKARLHYLNGEPREALEFAEKEHALRTAFAGQPEEADYALFLGLCQTAMAERSDPERRHELRAQAQGMLEEIEAWAHVCEDNFRHKAYLLAGERHREAGRPEVAIDHFDRAVASAAQHGFHQYVALSHELAASALRASRDRTGADARLRLAISAYREWGATAKAEMLAGALGS